jgi:polyisoprenyl-phosphate glycosyltransferase
MEYPNEISIVSPVYQSSGNITELINRIMSEVSQITERFEIVLVEDGSSDESWNEILINCKLSNRVKGIRLSRNFGQHYAVTAGLKYAQGEKIVIMDCDLQDDPAAIKLLYLSSQQGNEIVFTRRMNRKQSFFKELSAKIYNLLFLFFSNQNYDANTGSMVLFSARVKLIFLELKDKDRLYVQLLKWIGFKQVYIPVAHQPRFSGRSSYNFGKLIHLAVQGWTSHSDKLLRLSIYGGFTISLSTFLISLYIVIRYILYGFQPGWPSLFIAILFSTGLILMSIGIVGIYIGKIFEQTKDRPLYIVDEKINLD